MHDLIFEGAVPVALLHDDSTKRGAGQMEALILNYSLKVTSSPSLRERLVARLREAIARGHFVPGERLRERALCESTGVSRSSLREALRELESEGLVTSIPNRGIIVSRIDPDLARSTFELRGALESLAVRLFVSRAGPQEVEALTAAFAALRGAYKSGEPDKIYDSKRAFYDALLKGAASPLLGPPLKSIHVRVSQLRAASLAQPSRSAESLREFEALFDAIRRGDADGAERACRLHVENAAKAALEGLAGRTLGEPGDTGLRLVRL